VDLPKPTYTVTSTPLATDTPTATPEVTETPAQLAMEMVEVPAYAPQQVEYVSNGGSKYILVDISEQHMYVYEGDALVYSFVASTGMNNATRAGTFAVQSKIPNAYGATWNIWMPSWLGIYWAGGLENGIHALPILPNGATLWAGYLGRPISYGCVVLGSYEAQLLYSWAEIGTPVEIQW
jgi:lipoprotein-anchoring transpeptidase ErfK/SrfK